MGKNLGAIGVPGDTGPGSAEDLRLQLEAIRAILNDHDAMHWAGKLSAPYTSDFSSAGSTGGGLTSSTTVRFRAVLNTPNGTTLASNEMSVALGGAETAVNVTFPQVGAGVTPEGYLLVAQTGASGGANCYQARGGVHDEIAIVSGAGASIDTDGKITLSTSAPTVVKIKLYPPNTQPAHGSFTNATSADDPLIPQMLLVPQTQTVNSDYTVYTVPVGNLTYIWTYSAGRLTSLVIKCQSVTIQRFTPSYNTQGGFAGFTQGQA